MSLPRDRFKLFVFGFPTVVDEWAQAISWNADRYVPLPMDYGEARRVVEKEEMDVLLFSDWQDVVR